MKKENKGITLIALVITIIILLILAAIVINLTIGQRGILNRAEEAGRNYTKSAKEEERQLGDLLNMIDGKGDFGNEAEIENQAPIYARLYTKNGTTDEILILASKEEAFLDYSSELTLKSDFGNIYENEYKTEEDLYKLSKYAEILQSDEWKELKEQNPEEAKEGLEWYLFEANKTKQRPWIRYENNGSGDWFYRNTNLIEVRILDEILPKTTSGWFEGCYALEKMTDIENLNTASVTDMSKMFYNCDDNLKQLDLSGLNTSNVTNMSEVFWNCGELTSLNIGGWDTSNVTNMDDMFWKCSGLTTLNIGGWNTSNVTNMNSMFNGCSGLTTLDIGGWNTSNVTRMNWMFSGCSRLTSLDIRGWNTSNVTSMHWMFWKCSGLTSLDLSEWNTSNVTDMSYMFRDCGRLMSLDLSGWDTSNVTSMGEMFRDCSGLSEILVGNGWDMSKVTDKSNMFYLCGVSDVTYVTQ